MSNVLFYENPVAVNREQHRSTKVSQHSDYAFARKTNSVALTVVEFVEASKEYPIVFAAVGDRKVPVALLGLRDQENLFIDADGQWKARYIPAFVRRYPFVLAQKTDEVFIVCIDQAAPAFNTEAGQALFDEAGENTAFLDAALDFLNAYQAQNLRTEAFVNALSALDLFTEMSAKSQLLDGRAFLFNGLYIVDENKLLALDDAAAAGLLKSAQVGWIYAHLMSLSNLSQLLDRITPVTENNAAKAAH